jgi:hypothetical protein
MCAIDNNVVDVDGHESGQRDDVPRLFHCDVTGTMLITPWLSRPPRGVGGVVADFSHLEPGAEWPLNSAQWPSFEHLFE